MEKIIFGGVSHTKPLFWGNIKPNFTRNLLHIFSSNFAYWVSAMYPTKLHFRFFRKNSFSGSPHTKWPQIPNFFFWVHISPTVGTMFMKICTKSKRFLSNGIHNFWKKNYGVPIHNPILGESLKIRVNNVKCVCLNL